MAASSEEVCLSDPGVDLSLVSTSRLVREVLARYPAAFIAYFERGHGKTVRDSLRWGWGGKRSLVSIILGHATMGFLQGKRPNLDG